MDDAELVWQLTETFTQEQAAKAMGWSRPLVAQYAQLKKIDEEAWAVVVTGFKEVVTTPFTENLLRNILDLSADQQKRLCKWLAKGKDPKGHGFGHGNWLAMFHNKEVPFGERTAQRLMSVADDGRLSNTTHVSYLPQSWGTLYELKDRPQVSDRTIAKGLGVSHPTVAATRKEMEEKNELVKFTSSIGADGKERPRQVAKPAPEPARHVSLFSAAAREHVRHARATLERPIQASTRTCQSSPFRPPPEQPEPAARASREQSSPGVYPPP